MPNKTQGAVAPLRPTSAFHASNLGPRSCGQTVPRSQPMRKSVLIVDDHEAVRRELRRLFRDYEEFTVCGEAQDGSEALTKAQQLLPDLIILDLVMPEMG